MRGTGNLNERQNMKQLVAYERIILKRVLKI
jgi:hypothetical protein